MDDLLHHDHEDLRRRQGERGRGGGEKSIAAGELHSPEFEFWGYSFEGRRPLRFDQFYPGKFGEIRVVGMIRTMGGQSQEILKRLFLVALTGDVF